MESNKRLDISTDGSTKTFTDGIRYLGFNLISRLRENSCLFYIYDGKQKLFFSTALTLTGEEVLKCYRSWFQIEFFRDTKQFAGLRDSQVRDSWKLNYAFNASFTSLNVAKVMMKEIGMDYSMVSFKSLMFNTYLMKRIFKTSGYRPNQTLISKIFKDFFCLQRKVA
jgi:hypothetical protein